MRIRSRVLPFVALAAVSAAHSVEAQSAHSDRASVAQIRDERFKWFFGASAGALMFETQRQTQSGVPAIGAHIAVVARRAGLMLGVDEAFGSKEPSAFLDSSNGNALRLVTFDRIRRYAFNLTGYPVRGSLQPYLGVGFGLLQVINPQPDPSETFTSSDQAAQSAAAARDLSATGFMSFLAGVQFKLGRVAAFGQYQLSSSPSPGNLIRGSGHSLMGGLRFSLGSAKEDIKGGGY